MAFITDEVKVDDYRVQALNRVLKIEDEVIRNMAVPEHFHMNGWVYVLSNEAMPGIYKIGMTTTTPEVRAREISQGTGVPLPYKVEYAFYSQNPREDEAEIHEMLSDYRVNQNREFFRCDIEYILDACSGQMLFSREDSVELIADRCNVITFDKTSKLNLAELFEDIGISAFGDLNAVAEGLIRMSARVIRARDFDGISVLFSNGKAQRIMQEITQNYEAYLADHPEKDSDEKACNSPL